MVSQALALRVPLAQERVWLVFLVLAWQALEVAQVLQALVQGYLSLVQELRVQLWELK